MDSKENTLLWNKVMELLKEKYVQPVIDLFFKDTTLAYTNEYLAVIVNHNDYLAKALATQYKKVVEEAIEKVLGRHLDAYFESDENAPVDIDRYRYGQSAPKFVEDGMFDPLVSVRPGVVKHDNFYDSRYTFENFIVGASNTFAHAACQAVAREGVNSGYNPLFIYGGSGLGKTHLLYAIINETLRLRPDTNIVYAKCEDFTNEIISAIRNSTTQQFRDKYRKADMLLIDDVQFIAGKESTQEEFFHTFNALYDDRKQIVLTSDRPARDINPLTERMHNRFEWGLMADVQAPDYELRIAIMQNKAQSYPVSFPQEVFAFLAEHLKTNIRQMEGAINKIAAMARLQNIPVTVDLATKCISDIVSTAEPDTVVVARIISAVSQKYGISEADMRSKKRMSEICHARNIAMYIARTITDMTLEAIAREFGRNHTTAMACISNVEKDLKEKAFLDMEINELIKEIKE